MPSLGTKLIELYTQLGGLAIVGLILGRFLPSVVPLYLGKFLFWAGIPIAVVGFVRRSDLSGAIWLAPAIAWVAILLGAFLSWGWLKIMGKRPENSSDADALPEPAEESWNTPRQGSFLLSSMVGNTGYMGYPVILALFGDRYFAWALFYDLLGTVVGAYGLGVVLAAEFGEGGHKSPGELALAIVKTPTLWGLGLGLLIRDVPLFPPLEQSLASFGRLAIAASLVLLGMRLSQLHNWSSIKPASVSLAIKMLLVPLALGIGLFLFDLPSAPHLILVLQMGMPPAFATLVIAEAYNLDRDLTVTALALGSMGFLLLLPFWLWLFGV
ncbi:AEC family transporter [Phormidium sp. CCY1219]|uniref:AEC family transporter n=1 Tax=Phormidium sp. CCY1219 TaxID=2886104 RepID=UPI002D1F1516|nr:AEC family transporter [Phormidium sp. CCY1219]MEB3829063.1 AEC family transporter [Phormidium sp. CCY1219]